MADDGDDDGDGDPPCRRTAGHGSSDAGPPRLPYVVVVVVVVDSCTTRTKRNPDWCSSGHSPKRLLP